MGLREDAIAAVRAKSAESDLKLQQEHERRVKQLSERELRSKTRAIELSKVWIIRVAKESDPVGISLVEYYFKPMPIERENVAKEDSPAWRNGVLLTWMIGKDRFLGEFHLSNSVNTFGNSREGESFEVWIVINGTVHQASTLEQLGRSYLGVGPKWEYRGQKERFGISPYFLQSRALYPFKMSGDGL